MSEDDVKDTIVYEAMSDFDGKHFDTKIYGRDLKGVAKWKDGDELPVPISSIRARASEAFRKQFPQFKNFKLTSLNLLRLALLDDWFVQAQFNGDDPSKPTPNLADEKNINIFILLNGHIIAPTVQ